jgi:hypothetical protein
MQPWKAVASTLRPASLALFRAIRFQPVTEVSLRPAADLAV